MNYSQQSCIQNRLSAIASATAGESNHLRAYKALYNCRESSTNRTKYAKQSQS